MSPPSLIGAPTCHIGSAAQGRAAAQRSENLAGDRAFSGAGKREGPHMMGRRQHPTLPLTSLTFLSQSPRARPPSSKRGRTDTLALRQTCAAPQKSAFAPGFKRTSTLEGVCVHTIYPHPRRLGVST